MIPLYDRNLLNIVASVVAEADRDWANLEPNALQQYLGRARRVYNDDSPPLSSTRPSFILNQRAFWLFYVQSLKATQQQGLNPHRGLWDCFIQ